MKFTDALQTAVSYIAEDALETVYDGATWLEHTASMAMLAVLTWGTFLLLPITAPLWALEIQKDPEGAELAQQEKNARND